MLNKIIMERERIRFDSHAVCDTARFTDSFSEITNANASGLIID